MVVAKVIEICRQILIHDEAYFISVHLLVNYISLNIP